MTKLKRRERKRLRLERKERKRLRRERKSWRRMAKSIARLQAGDYKGWKLFGGYDRSEAGAEVGLTSSGEYIIF